MIFFMVLKILKLGLKIPLILTLLEVEEIQLLTGN